MKSFSFRSFGGLHVLACVTACGVLGLMGCASDSRATGNTEATATPGQLPPERFTLSITVLDMSGRSPAASSARGTPTWSRPARYVVEGDWLLRSSVGPRVTPAGLVPPLPTEYPPITRQLGHDEAAVLWTLVQRSGMMDGSAGRRVSKEPDVFDPRDAAELAEQVRTAGDTQKSSVAGAGSVMLIEYRAGENHGRLVADAAAANSAGLRTLVSRLAEWAWVE